MLCTTEQNVHSLTIQSLEGILMFTITLKLNVRLGAKDGFGKAPVSSVNIQFRDKRVLIV